MKGCINITDGEISLFSIQPMVCDFKIGAQRRMHWERERSEFSGAHDHLSTVILWLEKNPTVKGKNSTMHSQSLRRRDIYGRTINYFINRKRVTPSPNPQV